MRQPHPSLHLKEKRISPQFTHPVRDATMLKSSISPNMIVSIHAPRVGCDSNRASSSISLIVFQFTHPVWGATSATSSSSIESKRFNSRTPCGVRPQSAVTQRSQRRFQFTHPVWGATSSVPLLDITYIVSIHAPRVGCDFIRWFWDHLIAGVSIHAPRVGCDTI